MHTLTPKKKWTHYLWEFVMLFLAVFCGFLAENLREHYVEREREVQYMKSMIKDNYAKNNKVLFGLIDTLIHILKSPEIKQHVRFHWEKRLGMEEILRHKNLLN